MRNVSTPTTAHTLGSVGVSVSGERAVLPSARSRDELAEKSVTDLPGPTNEVPMQFVRLGLPVAIFLWFVVGLIAYGAYRLLVG
jgi:hypothetical protein